MGRPPIDKQARSADTHIRQTPQEKAEWEAAARSQGMTLAELIRAAVTKFIAQLKKNKK